MFKSDLGDYIYLIFIALALVGSFFNKNKKKVQQQQKRVTTDEEEIFEDEENSFGTVENVAPVLTPQAHVFMPQTYINPNSEHTATHHLYEPNPDDKNHYFQYYEKSPVREKVVFLENEDNRAKLASLENFSIDLQQAVLYDAIFRRPEY